MIDMKPRKLSKDKTSIQVSWAFKDEFSKYRRETNRFVKKNEGHYESDAEILERFFIIYKKLVNLSPNTSLNEFKMILTDLIPLLNGPSNNIKTALPWITTIRKTKTQ